MTKITYAIHEDLSAELERLQKFGYSIKSVQQLLYNPRELKAGLPSDSVFLIVYDEPIQKEIKE